MRPIALCTLVAIMLGCGGSAELDTGFEATLTDQGSCAGYLYAGAANESVLLVFHILESPTSIVADGGQRTYDFAQDTNSLLYVEMGSGLATDFCSATPAGGDVDARYHAVSGSGTLELTEPQPDTYEADLTLSQVLFRKELADHEVLMPALSLLDITLDQ